MTTKIFEDLIPLKDVKVNSAKDESNTEKRQFIRAVVEGLRDLEEGRELSIAEVKKRLLKLPT